MNNKKSANQKNYKKKEGTHKSQKSLVLKIGRKKEERKSIFSSVAAIFMLFGE